MLSRQPNSHTQLRDLPFDFTAIQTLDIPTVAVASAAAIGITKFLGYTKFQFMTASTLGGIPTNYQVVELDCQDGN